MGEMVDRVANAIIGEMFAPHEIPVDAELWSKYLVTAHAAIRAMMNPTNAMLDDAIEGEWDPMIVWSKMVRAALSD